MIVHKDLVQGSDAWLQIRCGKITASRFSDVMAKTKTGVSKTRLSYLYDIVAEKLTQKPAEQYSNAYMQWGTETEPLARAVYQEKNPLLEIQQVGFVEFNDAVGCSPDGLVGDFGLLEIKCPKTTTQIQRWVDKDFPSEYMAQVQGQMWVCDREWTDFVSYDPRILNDKSFFKVRVERDDKYIKAMISDINIFIDDMNELISKLNAV